MYRSYSLHKIIDENQYPFNPMEYSQFKFGENLYAKKFAFELFNGFIKQYKELLLQHDEIIIFPSPYLSIPTASNFLCSYFKRNLNSFLFENDRKACIESKIYRNQTYVIDYGNLDFNERINLISNDTYYIDKSFVNSRLCVFLDDIKITGSHEHTVKKILNEYDVNGEYVFVYFAELVNKDIHPKIENLFNYFAVKGVRDIIGIINKSTFQFNTRIIKFILNLRVDEFDYLLNNIPPERCEELFDLAISNNYHQILEYKNNINSLKLN